MGRLEGDGYVARDMLDRIAECSTEALRHIDNAQKHLRANEPIRAELAIAYAESCMHHIGKLTLIPKVKMSRYERDALLGADRE